jgi:Cd2+/Zn2+-exporting ATPase
MVTVQREGQEVLVPLVQVSAGETLLVRSGERIGADGVVSAGRAAVSQAAITGEGLPVDKVEGDEVFAGTLNERGVLQIRVSRVGEDTTLGQIVRLVQDAQRSQAPVQRLANRYAQFLVPLSFAVAILVYALTRDIMRSITVLVVVCPCALVLSTPTAVVAAIGNAAKRGILVRSGSSMEQIGRVDVVALDKTGTLTSGRPVLCEVIAWHGTAERMLQLAAAAERYSEHPIGRALVAGAEQRGLVLSEPQEVTILPGYGLTARVEGLEVIVGSQALLAEHGVAWPAVAGERTAQLEQEGYTVVPVALGGCVVGLLGLADALRPTAAAAVKELKALGIGQVSIISGDNRGAVARVARELDIDSYQAQVLPQDKLTIIRQLRAAGKRVAYVGDGVNDAPALAAADIGIAMGLSGTDVTIETAAICLTADEIERVPQAINLSRRTLQVIGQNVVFSMGVNVLSVVLGSLGIIGPVAGALIHELSALPVLANSARLINYRLT